MRSQYWNYETTVSVIEDLILKLFFKATESEIKKKKREQYWIWLMFPSKTFLRQCVSQKFWFPV